MALLQDLWLRHDTHLGLVDKMSKQTFKRRWQHANDHKRAA